MSLGDWFVFMTLVVFCAAFLWLVIVDDNKRIESKKRRTEECLKLIEGNLKDTPERKKIVELIKRL